MSAPGPFLVSENVRDALAEGRPVVALETSVLAQGLPAPHNLDAAAGMASAIRDLGAEPAWVWVDAGAVRVGATEDELGRLSTEAVVAKVARRDLPMAVAGGGLGATTVSATLWAAHRAGIDVMATGGIGGVHWGTGDVSADLLEMARTPGTVVCSGPKSILDPAATLERLEELGIGVVGYRCARLPFFLVRESDLELEHRAESPEEVAGAVRARDALGVESSLLICNPIPVPDALSADEVATAVQECEALAERQGVTGKSVTPFLLSCVAERTGGSSIRANLSLLRANAALAAEIAAVLSARRR